MKPITCTKCQAAVARATESLGIANEAQARLFDLQTALQGCVDELELYEKHATEMGDADLLRRLNAARLALNGPT